MSIFFDRNTDVASWAAPDLWPSVGCNVKRERERERREMEREGRCEWEVWM